MNKKLLPIIRHSGDVLFSINGENKVSFDLAGNWVNNHTATFTGDQGCVFPNRANEEDVSALSAVVRTLNALKVVPFQNDSTYEKFATEAASTWLTKTLPEQLVKIFREQPDVFKVQASFIPTGETEASITVSVELTSNQYAASIFENLGDVTFFGKVKSVTMSDEGKTTYVYVDADGNENTVTRSMDDNMVLLGLDTFTLATHLFSADNNTLIVTTENFVPVIEETKFVKI